MASMNKVILIGNLTREPELRYIPSGSSLAKFGLAMNRKYKVGDDWKEEVTFVDVTAWGKQAETCSRYLTKGNQVCVEGRLTFSQWETDEGQKRSKLDVTAERVVFLGSAGSAGGAGGGGGGGSYRGDDSFNSVPSDDDVPF